MKRFFIGLLLFLSIVVVAAIAAPFFIDIDHFRGPIVEAAQKRLGRGVEAGRISWKLLPSISVSLENIALHETTDLDSPVLFKAKALAVSLRWGPLLAKQVDVGSVVLTQPAVSLARGKDGRVAILAGQRAGASAEPSTEPAAEPAAHSEWAAGKKSAMDWDRFRLGRLDVVDGSVQWQDGRRVWQFDGVNATVSNIGLEEKVRFKGSVLVDGSATPLRLAGSIGPVSKAMIEHSDWEGVAADIHLTAQNIALEPLQPLLRQSAISSLGGKADVDLNISRFEGNMDLDVDFRGDAMALRMPGKFRKVAGEILRVKAACAIQTDRITVEKATLAIGSSKAAVSRSYYDRKGHDFEAKLTANIELENFLPWMDEVNGRKFGAVAQGSAALDLAISGNGRQLAAAKVEGAVDFESLRLSWPGFLTRVVEGKGSLQIQSDAIRLRNLEWKIGRSDLHLDGKIALKQDATGQISIASRYLDIAELTSLFVKPAAPAVSTGRATRQGPAGKGQVLKALPAAGQAPAGPAAAVLSPQSPSPRATSGIGAWSFEGDCKMDTVLFGRNTLQDVEGRIIFREGTLTLSKFTASCFRGGLSTALQVNLMDPDLPFRWGMRSKELQINDAIEANSNFGGRVFGRLNAQMELVGRASGGIHALLQSLEGAGQVEVRDMRISTFNLMNRLSLLTGLLGIKQEDFDETRFSRLTSQVQVRGGRVITPNVQAEGDNFNLEGSGSFGFDRVLDYELQVRLNKQLTDRLGKGEFVQAMLDQDRTVQIPFAIHGPLDGPPRFEPRWNSILAQKATDYLTRKIFKRKTNTEEQVATDTQTGPVPQQEAAAEPTLEDLLTQILKK